MRNIFNKKEVFSIRKFSMGAASVMITASLLVLPQGNNWQLKAKENIQVQVNKDISVNVIEKHGGAEVELIATKDVTNIDVNVMLDGNRVISYHIDSLKSGVSTKKYITKEQLDIIKKLISNGQKTLPNTAIVEKNISQSIVLSGYNLKVDVKYHVEEEPKAEQPKVEQPKVETPKVEQPKVEQPKVETPKVEQPKVETPKVEQPKVEIPKVPQTIKRVEVRTEAIAYKIEERNNDQLPQGTRKVVTAGKNGSYKVVRDDIYEGEKLVKQGAEQNIDRIEAVNEVVEIGTKVPQATTDTYFVLDTENNWFVTSEQTDALTKLFGTANGNIDVTSVVEKLKDPENYKLFNKLNLGQYFNKVNNPASVQKMINDYALKNQLEINKKFIDLANVERIKAGLVPAVSAFENTFMNKKVDSFVQDMVNERAKEMADYGSSRYLGKKEGKHKRPDGRSWYTVYSDKGIDLTGTSDDNHRYNMAGENAGQGNWGDLYFLTTPDEIIKDMFYGWMASPGHRALILNDVPHPIFAFSYRQGLKDYLGSKNKPTVAMLHVTSWFNPLDYPVSKEEYEKWRLDPKNKDNIVASEEYYNFLKVNTKNKATQ